MPVSVASHRPQIGNRKVGRERGDLALQPRRQQRRIALGPDVERAQLHVPLERQIDEGPRLLEHHHVLAVADDADDFEQRLGGSVDAQPLADGILPWPILLGHCFVDDRQPARRGPLVFVIAGECPAANDRDLHRLEVAVPRMVEEGGGRLSPGRR